MITEISVFEAVRRGYNQLELSTNEEILNYFSEVTTESSIGHLNNIKGILFEQLYVEQLAGQGIDAAIFEATNYPVVDITIFDDDIAVSELQLKATDSAAYITATLQEYPDVAIVATSEVASQFSTDMVINSGIENAAIEEAVSETLFEEAVNPFSAFSLLRWLIGIPF